ncbi:MAG: hypothetical protein JNK78_19835 [Planctomycetes bacterium]|nr:hypothetical protein [Planctomycetota bacterium]
MKFDRHKDPAACAAKESTRYAVQGIAVVEKGDATFLAATDGRSLSMVRAYPEDGDDMPSILGQGRVYPPAAFAAARRACKRKADAALTLNGSACVQADGSTTEFARVDGAFPDVLGIVPKGKAVQTLRVNAELLARLQKAMGANGVAIEIHELDGTGQVDPTFPLTIRPLYMEGPGTDDGSFGILMPIRGD